MPRIVNEPVNSLSSAETTVRRKTEPIKREFRIERHEVLWYPTVTASLQTKEILSVAPGVPHCQKCIVPLKTSEGSLQEWVCLGCGARYPESILDSMVINGVTQQALGYFQERHAGFNVVKNAKDS